MAAAGGVIIALIGLFGVLFSQRAPLQVALNGAFEALTRDLQQDRSVLIARVSELTRELEEHERLIEEFKGVLLERDGEIRGLQQLRDSLLKLLTDSGVELPTRRNLRIEDRREGD